MQRWQGQRTAPRSIISPIISSTRRMRTMVRQRSRRDAAGMLTTASVSIEVMDGITNLVNVVIGQRRIHRQEEEPLEQLLRIRKRDTEAEPRPLMDRLATPLDQCSDALRLEMFAQLIASPGLDFVVLKYVEVIVIGIGRW